VNVFFQIWSSVSSVSWAWSHSSAQSAQPISELCVPGTDTADGWVTGSPRAASGAGPVALTTPAQAPSAVTRPAASFTTARYSRTEPTGRPDTSWYTRNGALSSVPMVRHADVPTGRYRKVVWAKVSVATIADTSARPPTPDAGSVSVTVGAAPLTSTLELERHTATDSAGNWTVTVRSLPDLTMLVVPYTGLNCSFWFHVSNVADAAAVELFAATTYSTPASLS